MTERELQPPTIFETIGGAEAVRALVNRFYDLMDGEAEFAGIRGLHPKRLDSSREKLYLFLSGWMGGPPLYVEKYGHPRLRARHLPFSIGLAERDQWIACMRRAMADTDVHPDVRSFLNARFFQVADFMRNREG